MTSRNAQKLPNSSISNMENSANTYKHRRHHESGIFKMDLDYNPDKPIQQLLVKNEHRHDQKVIGDGNSDVQSHAIQSMSGLLRNERQHAKKPRMYYSTDPKLYSDAVINMNHLCENCHLPKLNESIENSEAALTSKSKGNLKFFNAKSSSTKHVQTSKTKLKQKRTKQGDEVKHHHSRHTVSRKFVGKGKKEIYIITGGDTPFKFTTISQEHLRKHKKHSDRKLALTNDTKLDGAISVNCEIKPNAEHTSQETVCLMSKPESSFEFSKQQTGALSLTLRNKSCVLSAQKTLLAIDKGNRQEVIPETSDEGKNHEKDQALKDQMVTVATDISRLDFGKYKEKQVSTHFPKVISTKLKHKHKKSDGTLSDKTKSGEERSQKRHKREHRHKHSKAHTYSLPAPELGMDSDDKVQLTKRVSALLKKHSIQSNLRKQSKQSSNMHNDVELNRKRILDNIEMAYSKHKHILPKEAVDALDRNIKEWRNMDVEKKSSDQISNVLDLEEVLKKNKKGKLRPKDGSAKPNSEKTLTTTSESTLRSGLKKTIKPQNDLILLNAIVTGINNIDCDKDTVHVNKIPKFVRLEEIVCEPDMANNKKVLSKINLIQECASEMKDNLLNYTQGAVPKIKQSQIRAISARKNEDVRKEVSFSHLNVQPAISLYTGNDQHFNYIDGLLPSLLREKRFMKPKKKRVCIEKDLLNIFMRQEGSRRQIKSPSKHTITHENDDCVFNVDGVEPPKKRKSNIPDAYVPRKSTSPGFKKLDLVVLPVLEVPPQLTGLQSPNDGMLLSSTTKFLKHSRTQTRKKENHRTQKSSRSSASSSESTVQLMSLLDSPIKVHSVPQKRKRGFELNKLYISDNDAIAALKYLSPHHRECDEIFGRNIYRRRKLEKIILSTVEIKSEIPTTASNYKCNTNLEERASKMLNRYDSKARTLIPSKETEFLFKSSRDSDLRVIDSTSYCIDPINYTLDNLLNDDKSLEDYVTQDKYDCKKPDRSRPVIPSLDLNATGKSNHSVCSSIDDKNRKRLKTPTNDSGGVRSRMLSYSRNIEQRKKRSKGSTGSSRDSSNEGELTCAQKNFSKQFLNTPDLNDCDDKPKKHTQSLSGASTSSGVSLNSESEKHSDLCKLHKKEEPVANKESKDLAFESTIKEHTDVIKTPSEVISAALTKITEETISQDTLNGSDFSHYSKKEENEPKVIQKMGIIPEKSSFGDKNVKFDINFGKKLNHNENSLKSEKSQSISSKPVKTVKPVERSSSPAPKPKRDESFDKKDSTLHSKKNTAHLSNSKPQTPTSPNRSVSTKEKQESARQQYLKEEELQLLADSVKKSIINEMQTMNTMNIQNLMQLFMKNKEETDKNSLEEMISKNIENALKKRKSIERLDNKNHEKVTPHTNTTSVSGDFNLESLNKHDKRLDINDTGSIKSMKSKKSDNASLKSFKSVESENRVLKKKDNPFNTQKIQIVNNCTVNNQISENSSTINKSLVEKNAKPKGKRICKLVRSIPKSIVKEKDSLNQNKPVSAPTGFDKSKVELKVKKNVTISREKSVISETKTSLTNTRIGSAKETFRAALITSKDSKGLSKFEKRKQYGEQLRQKAIKPKNDNATVGGDNHTFTYPPKPILADGDNTVNVPTKKQSHQQQPSDVKESSSNCVLHGEGLDAFNSIGNNINTFNGASSKEAGTSRKPSQETVSSNRKKISSNNEGDNLVSPFIKTVKSLTRLNKSNSVDESKTNESETIYQTFTVIADHPHIIDVFKNKFKKTSSMLSASNKGSLYSTLSTSSINTTEKSAKCSGLFSSKKSDHMFQPLEKVKSLLRWNKHFYERKESGLASSYECSNSTTEMACSPKGSDTDHSLTNLNKLSRVKINLLEVCQQLCNDDNTQKYTLYSPHTCFGKNTKMAEKELSAISPKNSSDKNLHRCKQKFNIHSMLKINETNRETHKEYSHTKRFSEQNQIKPKYFNSSTTCSNLNNTGSTHDETDRQGNYIVFKIDKKLHIRQENSTKDKECFKIFMNNNLHNMKLDRDYPLRFSKYDFKSNLFGNNKFLLNSPPFSDSGDSEHDSNNKNFLHTFNKGMETNSSKSSFSTVITFPFNLKMTSNSTDLNSRILSAEKDSASDIRANNTETKVVQKSRLEQLCESVTNLYRNLCNANSTDKVYSECDTGYLTDSEKTQHYSVGSAHPPKYFQTQNNMYQYTKGKKCSFDECIEPNTSKLKKSELNYSINENMATILNLDKNLKTNSLYEMNSKNTQTTSKKLQKSDEYKKNSKKSQKDDDKKKFNHKLVQANIRRKHKRFVQPEVTSRSTSYDSIRNEEQNLACNSETTQFVPRTYLIDLLKSNPEFYTLLTTTIKKILTSVHILPIEASEEVLRSIVEESFHTVIKDFYQLPQLEKEVEELHSTEKTKISQETFNTNAVDKKKLEKEIKDLRDDLVRGKLLMKNNVSKTFDEILIELLHDVLNKVVDFQQSCSTNNKTESRDVFNKTEKLNDEKELQVEEEAQKLPKYDTINLDTVLKLSKMSEGFNKFLPPTISVNVNEKPQFSKYIRSFSDHSLTMPKAHAHVEDFLSPIKEKISINDKTIMHNLKENILHSSQNYLNLSQNFLNELSLSKENVSVANQKVSCSNQSNLGKQSLRLDEALLEPNEKMSFQIQKNSTFSEDVHLCNDSWNSTQMCTYLEKNVLPLKEKYCLEESLLVPREKISVRTMEKSMRCDCNTKVSTSLSKTCTQLKKALLVPTEKSGQINGKLSLNAFNASNNSINQFKKLIYLESLTPPEEKLSVEGVEKISSHNFCRNDLFSSKSYVKEPTEKLLLQKKEQSGLGDSKQNLLSLPDHFTGHHFTHLGNALSQNEVLPQNVLSSEFDSLSNHSKRSYLLSKVQDKNYCSSTFDQLIDLSKKSTCLEDFMTLPTEKMSVENKKQLQSNEFNTNVFLISDQSKISGHLEDALLPYTEKLSVKHKDKSLLNTFSKNTNVSSDGLKDSELLQTEKTPVQDKRRSMSKKESDGLLSLSNQSQKLNFLDEPLPSPTEQLPVLKKDDSSLFLFSKNFVRLDNTVLPLTDSTHEFTKNVLLLPNKSKMSNNLKESVSIIKEKLPIQDKGKLNDFSKTQSSSSDRSINLSKRLIYSEDPILSPKEKMSFQDKKKLLFHKLSESTLNTLKDSTDRSKKSTLSQESLSLQKQKLSLEEKQLLIRDLKAFGNTLTELKHSITQKQSEPYVQFCSVKISDGKMNQVPSSKESSHSMAKDRSCKCSKPLEQSELLKNMAKLPLSAIMQLHKKVTNSNDPEISFESVIKELHRVDSSKSKIDETTESQDRILKALRNSLTNINTCKYNFNIEKKVLEHNKEEKENYSPLISISPNLNEKKEVQNESAKKNMKISDSLSGIQEDDNEKQSTSIGSSKTNGKQSSDLKNKEVNDLNASGSSNTPIEEENKRKALNKIKEKLTDKELFDKLLESYENEEKIVNRLSKDEDFLRSQLKTVKSKESIEVLLKQPDLPVQLVDDLETIAKDQNIIETVKPEKPPSNVNPVKKSSSRFLVMKTKMGRLFKGTSTSQELKEFASTSKSLNISENELIQKGGKLQLSKGKLLEKYKKEEGSLSSNDSNFVKPQDIGKYFVRGFRGDQMLLSGGSCGKPETEKRYDDNTSIDSIIEFSERDTPLEYLLALGYSIEEASNAIKDEDVENRLYAAITEARIWVNHVNSIQGTLLYLIAYKAKPKIMRYYLQLVEAIINNRISNAVKLDSFLKVLERVEDGDISMLNVLGSYKFEEEENEEYLLKKQLHKVFIDVYRVAEKEATSRRQVLTKNQINLLKVLAAKYRAGLQSHQEVIARYIGKDLLRSQVQLEAAMIYFSRLDSSDIDLQKFEKYCGIKSKV